MLFDLLTEEHCWVEPNPTAYIVPTLTNIVTNGSFTINLYDKTLNTSTPQISIGPIAGNTGTYTFQNPIPDSDFEIEIVDSLAAAVDAANQIAAPGDVVLLSPGCASYDMFDNFQHRGQEFVKLVTRRS